MWSWKKTHPSLFSPLSLTTLEPLFVLRMVKIHCVLLPGSTGHFQQIETLTSFLLTGTLLSYGSTLPLIWHYLAFLPNPKIHPPCSWNSSQSPPSSLSSLRFHAWWEPVSHSSHCFSYRPISDSFFLPIISSIALGYEMGYSPLFSPMFYTTISLSFLKSSSLNLRSSDLKYLLALFVEIIYRPPELQDISLHSLRI